jgi:hypothetical protein
MLQCDNLAVINGDILDSKVLEVNWKDQLVCEEELMIPQPLDFNFNFNFLEVSRSEALQDFLESLPSHVNPDFSRQTEILDLLRGFNDVFVPESWEGIQGIEPVSLDFDVDMPKRIKPSPRRIPASIFEASKKEFQRMCSYFYRPSTSPVSSPMVVAPKSTQPFVRICGDYRVVNKYLRCFHYPIPDVIKELHRLSNFKVFIELDVKNAFHGIIISVETSRKLSVQTPWGQYEPKFLPEGVSPASAILMLVMSEVFADCTEWMIVIFDNLLIMATDYDDAYDKAFKVLSRCRDRKVVLKLSKSKFGYDSVDFFGYKCRKSTYELSEERKLSVTAVQFPTGGNKSKSMQRFLGAAMYFKPFIYKYSEKTALLYDMIRKDFDWKESNWNYDYRQAFEDFKADILHSFTLYHPNYSLPWYLYVDASDFAVGGVLVQRLEDQTQQVLAFVSKKLSSTARRWSTYEKEAFGIFYAVQKLQYYLLGKKFVILTDHNNLCWMETSEVPKVIRIRLFLQGFDFSIIHVKGKQNVFADWLSRVDEDEVQDPGGSKGSLEPLLNSLVKDEISELLSKVHNSRLGHHGVQRTWSLLNKYFPGHGIPVRVVQDYVSTCPWCQKSRQAANEALKAPIRAVEPNHSRHYCSYDTLYVTPPDQEGFQYLHVFRMLPSRLIALYPSKDLTAESLATATFLFFTTYGITDVILTDPGSNITSHVMDLLLKWFGVRLRMSLVGRHQSNLVERSHRETLRFLSTLVNEERLRQCWSKPQVVATIQFILNSEASRETSMSPFEYVFGSVDAAYFKMPECVDDPEWSKEYLRVLNENLRAVREVAKLVQEKEQSKRTMADPDAGVNSYQVGDYVLVDEKKMGTRKSKLISRWSGPWEVEKVYKADVTLRHIVTGRPRVVHMENLKSFFGDRDEAFSAAKTDDDQYEIVTILYYTGDPEKRSTMSFGILFEDDDQVEVPYNQDLVKAGPFRDYCNSIPELIPLLHSLNEWKKLRTQMNSEGIKGVQPGLTCYVNLRAWGWDYYSSIGLDEYLTRHYVVECRYIKWTHKSNKKKIDLKCPLFGQHFEWSAVDVLAYGKVFELDPSMILVDEVLCQRFPSILENV